MKKTYINPEINIVMVKASNMLMASEVQGTAIKGSASSEYETLSREGGFFDDEE